MWPYGHPSAQGYQHGMQYPGQAMPMGARPGMWGGHPGMGGAANMPRMPAQHAQPPKPTHASSSGVQPGGAAAAAAAAAKPRGPPRREMDSLLEEIKAKQRLQEQKKELLKNADPQASAAIPAGTLDARPGTPGGSVVADPLIPNQALGATPASASRLVGAAGGLPDKDRTSPPREAWSSSTSLVGHEARSLFLRELPHSATEDSVCQLFSRYGIVCSVDIERQEDGKLSKGHVTLDTRDNAVRAKEALHDREVDGIPLWIEWAKGPPPTTDSEAFAIDGRDSRRRRIIVQPPLDRRKRRIIDRLAKYVSQDGHTFEQQIMDREASDGQFAFLFQTDTPDSIYYRWRVFAFAQGDNFQQWRTETFRIGDTGSWWTPPPCHAKPPEKKRATNFSSGPSMLQQQGQQTQASSSPAERTTHASSSATVGVTRLSTPSPAVPFNAPSSWTPEEIAEEQDRQRLEEKATLERQRRDRDRKGLAGGKRLTDADWDSLEQLLRNIIASRPSVLEAMAFCLDRSDSAIEITECIIESLSIVETEMPLKLARLFLVSDILHNTSSSRPAAWAYRREFEKSLPDVFEQIHIGISRLESRIAAEKAKEKVQKVLRIWEEWGLFSPQFMRGLEASLVLGVKSLRNLKARGDSSREPAWLELKLVEWRRQHFSQLEKMCRMRGMRSSTSHLEATKDAPLEQVRQEWLIDRLVCYDLHAHEREQSQPKPAIKVVDFDKDKKNHEDLDGSPLKEAELEGEPITIDDARGLVDMLEIARLRNTEALGGALMLSSSSDHRSGMPGLFGLGESAAAGGDDEAVGVLAEPGGADAVGLSSEALDGEPITAAEISGAGAGSQAVGDIDEMAEALLEEALSADAKSSTAAADGGSGEAGSPSSKKLDKGALREIELEVVELRASLITQGLHRDEIQDMCDERREKLMEEHEAAQVSKASPAHEDSQASKKDKDKKDKEHEKDRSSKEKERDIKEREAKEREAKTKEREAKEQEKERERQAKEKEKEKEREAKERKKQEEREREAKEREREAKEREKEKEREAKEREKERERARERADKEARDKKDERKEREKEKEKDVKAQKRERSRSRDAKRKRSPSRTRDKKKVRR